MYSMNRTSASWARANSIRSVSSSSLNPRITTALSLSLAKPACRAAARPPSTSACRALLANASMRSGRNVSRLTVTRCRPAVRNSAACFPSSKPLVVMARSRIRGLRAIIATSVERSWRSSGSPPVSRTLCTPRLANTPVSRSISSKVRIEVRGSHAYSSSGMQYRQRRLQRSVTDSRRLVSGRRSVSWMTSDMRRSCRWTARRIDPDFTAVHAQLLLPDRYATLHFLDHVAAGLERLGPMRRRRGDRDARLSHGDRAQPVPDGDARVRPASARIGQESDELGFHHLFVRRVLDRRHPLLIGPVAHGAQEHACTAARGGRDLGDQEIQGDWCASQVGRMRPRCSHPQGCAQQNTVLKDSAESGPGFSLGIILLRSVATAPPHPHPARARRA